VSLLQTIPTTTLQLAHAHTHLKKHPVSIVYI